MENKKPRPSFYSSKLKREIFLNAYSLADDEWRSEQWPNEESTKRLLKMDMAVFVPMLWRALDLEIRRLITNLKIYDEKDGKEAEVEFNTPSDRLKYILLGKDEILEAWAALLLALKSSEPDALENVKKKLTAVGLFQQPKPSISLPQNMDSAKNSSESLAAEG